MPYRMPQKGGCYRSLYSKASIRISQTSKPLHRANKDVDPATFASLCREEILQSPH